MSFSPVKLWVCYGSSVCSVWRLWAYVGGSPGEITHLLLHCALIRVCVMWWKTHLLPVRGAIWMPQSQGGRLVIDTTGKKDAHVAKDLPEGKTNPETWTEWENAQVNKELKYMASLKKCTKIPPWIFWTWYHSNTMVVGSSSTYLKCHKYHESIQ